MEITPRNSDVTASVAVFLPLASPIEPQRHHDTDKKVVEVADADDLPSIGDLRNSKFNLDFKTEGRPSATAASIDVGHLSADKATRNSSSPGFAKQRSMSDVAVSASGAASLSSTPDMAQTLVVAEPGSPAAKAIDITNQFDGKNNIRQTSKLTFKKPDGNEIDGQHEQYTLTYGMMTGILNSAGSLNMFKQRLTMNDFMRVDKREFPANLRSKLAHSFKFKDYSPDIFRQIRRRFDIDSADYMVTLCGDFNYIEFMSNSKSGQFFFYSHDGRFMIKTQTQDESKFLRRILPHYYKFVMENPNTLVTRFYGMHRVKMHHLKKQMHFVIMASVFNTPKEIHLRFDLKGSKVGRNATPHEKSKNGVLKDNDLVDEHIHLSLGPEKRAMMLEQLRKDVAFLKRMKIMDYSLLIGIHDSGQEILLSPTTHPTPPLLQLTSAVPRQPSAASSPLQTLNDLKLHEFGAMSSHISDTASDDNSDDDVEFTDAPLSPRTLDTTPKSPSGGSIFCKDFGGVLGRLSTRKKNGKIYFVGIIDILQQYNTRKITETVFKGLVHNKKDISSVPPDQYGDRFLDFIEKNVLVDE
ncbi:hypothetical protein H257_17790 [Aphanomyces astaci]|uniref:PIPK domain-containing protein n=1 Tax=Aphanomyces astaci TaxID=112090 RepID=W4FFL5_APHAT|nr:hypothetical protein H257_17790 [Aphanomyces astaci]ETV65533.1 hypothetical protein H257_17790 [Aphanomyces astaci]|eukprot:XP_009845021.1 hypothetical protein H257_17790 [Aphanomyces astaci]